jgi:hypothetical protein
LQVGRSASSDRHRRFTLGVTSHASNDRLKQFLGQSQWITFRDLTGAQHRIRASKISRISESTVAQRAAEREFHRARREEDRRDRQPWEDDEF